MIVISLFDKVEKTKKLLSDNTKWCYLGKDTCKQEIISNILSKERRFYLKDRLNKIAEEFSQPYLNFVSILGRHQVNQLTWWASRFASKSPYQTDFYLLFCYKILVDRLIDEYVKKQQSICIFIEDIWLFLDIETRYKGNEDILFIGNYSKIYINTLRLICRGIVFRILLAGRLFILRLITFYYYRNRKPTLAEQDCTTVGIISYGEKRALTSNKFEDPYTGELSSFLERNNIKVIRPLFALFPISLSKKIGKLWESIWPLILDVRVFDLLRVLKCWNPDVPSKEDLAIGGVSVRRLFKREILDEFSKTGFNFYLILYKIMKRFFGKKWCCSIIYLFENQPFEKIICIAAKDAGGVKLIGYQHSSVFKFIFSYFLGEGEKEFIPLPDKIITNGNNAFNLLKREGYPLEKIELGGAWRYTYLLDSTEKSVNYISNSKINLLVILPVDKYISRFIVKTVIQYYSDNSKVKFMIKPHPLMPIERLEIKKEEIEAFELINKPLCDIIDKYHIALYCNTTAGVESLLYGKTVIRLLLENYIDIDPLAGFDAPEIIKCYEEELAEKIEEAVKRIQNHPVSNDTTQSERFFSKIIPEVWLRVLDYQVSAVKT